MEKSDSIKELATALCKFQGEVEAIKKGSENPFYHSRYADLTAILDTIRKPLSENGLSFVQFPTGQSGLETMLMHTSGEWISATYEMKPVKNDPQGLGSAITYQRRYALGSILGLSTDDDDDGNSASKTANEKKQLVQPKENEPLTDLQIAKCDLEKTKSEEDVKTVWMNFPSLQTDKEFIRECNRHKAKYQPK